MVSQKAPASWPTSVNLPLLDGSIGFFRLTIVLGSALLIDGRPNRGCVTGANELGHTRLPVETDICFCGHPGCLERIVSTEFLRRRGVPLGSLLEHAANYSGGDSGANGGAP